METLSDAVRRMTEAGYTEQFRAEDGRLRGSDSGRLFRPEALVVESTTRFEGVSDPADEAVVFALRSASDGTRGTYVVAYGPDMDPADAKIVPRLETGRD